MAVMYPPQWPAHLTGRSAERKVYEALRKGFNGFTVLHSVGWTTVNQRIITHGEADFIIIHPERGALVVEVKGGRISTNAQEWYSTDWEGIQHRIKNPFDQARGSMNVLIGAIKGSPAIRHLPYCVGYLVIFPDTLIRNIHLGPNAPQDLVIDSYSLLNLEAAVARAFDKRCSKPGLEWVAGVIDLLAPRFPPTPLGMVSAMMDEAAKIAELTAEQEVMIDILRRQRKAAIYGVAGSGKTIIAVHKCVQLANEGLQVLYVCYNSALAASVQREIDKRPKLAKRLCAVNYHGMARTFIERAKAKLIGAGRQIPDLTGFRPDREHDFEVLIPELFAKSCAFVSDRYDAIVVDEGQDFTDLWFKTLFNVLKDPDEGVFFVFYDNDQRINHITTGYPDRYPIPADHYYELRRNCRSTRHIQKFALQFASQADKTPSNTARGRAPEEITVRDGEEQGVLARELDRLVNTEGLRIEDILILSVRRGKTARQDSRWLAEGAEAGRFTLTWKDDVPDAVRCRSIYSIKGLESKIVILVDPECADPRYRNALLYTACMRAQHHLVVFLRDGKPLIGPGQKS